MLLCHDPLLVWPTEDERGEVLSAQQHPHHTWQGKGYLSRSRYTLNDKDDVERAEGEKENQKHSKEDLRNKNELRDRRNRDPKRKKRTPSGDKHTHAITHTFGPVVSGMCSFVSGTAHTVAPMATFYTFSSLKICPNPRSLRHLRTCGLGCIILPYILRLEKRIAPRDGRCGIKDAIVMLVGGLERWGMMGLYEIKWEKINQKGFIPQLPLIPTKRHHSNGEAFVLLQQSRETMLCIKLGRNCYFLVRM